MPTIELIAHIEQLRETNHRLNRRCQQAESALPEWREIETKKFVRGSLGRGLLAWALSRAHEEDEQIFQYLFDSLPFEVRHYWGGDWREFREGVRKCALNEEPQPNAETVQALAETNLARFDSAGDLWNDLDED